MFIFLLNDIKILVGTLVSFSVKKKTDTEFLDAVKRCHKFKFNYGFASPFRLVDFSLSYSISRT